MSLLTVEPARADGPTAAALQPVFATNLAYLRAAGELTPDQTEIPPGHAADYLADETSDPASRCLLLRDGQGAVVGTAALLVPHPREPYPWIGLLLIHGDLQGGGYGASAVALLTDALTAEGWPAVRLGVLDANPGASVFWQRHGFRVIDHRFDSAGRPCSVLQRTLPVR